MQDENRKSFPLFSGMLKYFPDALLAVASVSMEGARKHDTFDANGLPTWNRAKSADDADALARHLVSAGGFDGDGHRHSAKVAWRSLAVLQKEIELGAMRMHRDDPVDEAALRAQLKEDLNPHHRRPAYDNAEQYAAKVKASRGAVDDTLKQNDTISLDRAAEGTFKEKALFAIYGDTTLSIEALAAMAGVPVDRMIDMRGNKPFKGMGDTETVTLDTSNGTANRPESNLTDIEKFAVWLTTRESCVHVGARHTVYDMFEAVEEYQKANPKQPPVAPTPVHETFGDWLDRRLGTLPMGQAHDSKVVELEYSAWVLDDYRRDHPLPKSVSEY